MLWADDRFHLGILLGTGAAQVEIVERKGIGHPDTICVALAEAASQALCRLYRERFGMLLHDKVGGRLPITSPNRRPK
jgi:S-adenosylmethionine synthetase